MAAEPAVGPDRGEVVDQAEEPEAEHREQHLAARQRQAGMVADAERAEDGATGFDHEHGDDDVEAARGRDARDRGSCAVPAPVRRGCPRSPCAGTDRHHADDQADDDVTATIARPSGAHGPPAATRRNRIVHTRHRADDQADDDGHGSPIGARAR